MRENFDAREKALEQERKARLATEAEREKLNEDIKRLQAKIATTKKANQAAPDTHDYNEEKTRDAFIDLLLHEVGWPLDQERDREFPVLGMSSNSGDGFVDYVLWGNDGKPLGLVEAKRTKKDSRVGQQQAKLYADCLEEQFGQRPVIYLSNGYEHWLWDDRRYPPRPVQGFYKKAELELLHQRRSSCKELAKVEIDADIAGRFYQTRAIKRVGEGGRHTVLNEGAHADFKKMPYVGGYVDAGQTINSYGRRNKARTSGTDEIWSTRPIYPLPMVASVKVVGKARWPEVMIRRLPW